MSAYYFSLPSINGHLKSIGISRHIDTLMQLSDLSIHSLLLLSLSESYHHSATIIVMHTATIFVHRLLADAALVALDRLVDVLLADRASSARRDLKKSCFHFFLRFDQPSPLFVLVFSRFFGSL